MSSEPTLLDLLASDSELGLTQLDPGPSTSGSIAGSKPPAPSSSAKPKKRAAKTTEVVSREEFAAVQDKMAVIAEAMQTLQSTVVSALDSRPAKRQKTDETVSSSDESIVTDKAIELLLQVQEKDGTSGRVLDDIEQFYSSEDAGEKVDDKLAAVVSKVLRRKSSDDKITEKLNSFKRPSNIDKLEQTRVNPEIWCTLQSKTRSTDIRFQKVEQALLKSIVPIVQCMQSLMGNATENQKALMTKLCDSVAIIGYARDELNLRRREFIKPDLNRQFASLCSARTPVTGLLFGDNLSQQCKDIQETNKLSQQFGKRTESFANSKRGYGRQNYSRDAKSFRPSGQQQQGYLNSSRPKAWQRKKPAYGRQPTVTK